MKYNLIFTGWNEDLKKVSFTRLLREKAGLSFHAAKRILEAILLGEKTVLELNDVATARELKKETTKLGATSKLINIKTKTLVRG